MAKDRSFAAKLAHETLRHKIMCPVCQKEKVPYLVVKAVPCGPRGTQRFRRERVKICDCNKAQYGVA